MTTFWRNNSIPGGAAAKFVRGVVSLVLSLVVSAARVEWFRKVKRISGGAQRLAMVVAGLTTFVDTRIDLVVLITS